MTLISQLQSLSCSPSSLLKALVDEQTRRAARRKLTSYYPDQGPLRRELYPKHMQFFELGKQHRQRLCLAANRVGKTEGIGLYEAVRHALGDYPDWWPGRSFDRPVKIWIAGKTNKTAYEILQEKLLGPTDARGTGLIPGDSLVRTTPKHGIPDAVDTIYVKSKHGGQSRIVLKSYEQGRSAFEGTEQDVILLDEEPPLDIKTECVMRTMTTNGLLMYTFTPLEGLSETVMSMIPNGSLDECTIPLVMITWDDVPHLDEKAKAELWASIPPYQRDARSKGIPQLGSGAIYPVAESEIVCEPFAIPEHWPRAYGMDVGWNRTAVPWGAWDLESDTLYLYSEYYRGQAEPSIHAAAVRARGDWIQGVIDPAARGRGQADGQQLLQMYKDLGLSLTEADNGVESGIYMVFERLSCGKLKVFKTMQNWLSEYRLYRRDDKGRIVKANDHLMDGTRYLVASGRSVARVKAPDSINFNFEEVPA